MEAMEYMAWPQGGSLLRLLPLFLPWWDRNNRTSVLHCCRAHTLAPPVRRRTRRDGGCRREEPRIPQQLQGSLLFCYLTPQSPRVPARAHRRSLVGAVRALKTWHLVGNRSSPAMEQSGACRRHRLRRREGVSVALSPCTMPSNRSHGHCDNGPLATVNMKPFDRNHTQATQCHLLLLCLLQSFVVGGWHVCERDLVFAISTRCDGPDCTFLESRSTPQQLSTADRRIDSIATIS